MDGSAFKGLGSALVIVLLAAMALSGGCVGCVYWYVDHHYDIQVKRK